MQNNLRSVFTETQRLLLLALPIIGTGILESSYSFMNNFLVAHLGHTELAANALVSALFFTLMVIFWGTISGTSIVVAHYHGAKNTRAISGVVRDSLLLFLLLSIPVMLLLWYAPEFFLLTGQSPHIVADAQKYLHALTWAVPSDLLGYVLMQFFQGIARPRITFIATLLYIPLLIGCTYLLMFGKWGLPALGLAGIGWGTTIAYTLILILLVAYIFFQPAYHDYFRFDWGHQRYIKEVLRVGLPLGGMYCIEISYFLVQAILIGKISADALAANQITMQYQWVIMIVVYSFGQALSIRVGWRMGRQEPQWILPTLSIGFITAFIYIIFIAIIYRHFSLDLIAFDLGRHPSAADQVIITYCLRFFTISIIFQFVETLRSLLFSILRGLKDTRFTMTVCLLMQWGLAIPLGYYFAFHWRPGNPLGLWYGLIISTITSAAIYGWRLTRKLTG